MLARTSCVLLITSRDSGYTSLIPESKLIVMKISSLSIMFHEGIDKTPFLKYGKFLSMISVL